MKRTKMTIFMAVLAIMLSSTMVWADGGREPPNPGKCETPPDPTNESPVINGSFTASYFTVGDKPATHYRIHAVLKRPRVVTDKTEMENLGISDKDMVNCERIKVPYKDKNTGKAMDAGNAEKCPELGWVDVDLTRLHSFTKVIVIDKPLCKYTELDLYSRYWARPCNVEIQKEFYLGGHPVLTDMKITKLDHCDSKSKATMEGTFKIRVVQRSLK